MNTFADMYVQSSAVITMQHDITYSTPATEAEH